MLLFAELTVRYLANRELVGLKRSTLMDYESYARVHLLPAFGQLPLEAITVELIEDFIISKRQQGKATKSILNYVGSAARDPRLRGQTRLVRAGTRQRSSTSPAATASTTSASSTQPSSKRSWQQHRTTPVAGPNECST